MTLPFLTLWRETGMPDPVAEYRFAPPRRWRFDYAWPAVKVAVEFDGGQWLPRGGRHNSDTDRDKLNHAAVMSWKVLRFSNQKWEASPYDCVTLVALAIENTAKENKMIDYKARYRRLATENEELREAAIAALILLGNPPFANQTGPQVLSVVRALEEALDTEQDDEEDE